MLQEIRTCNAPVIASFASGIIKWIENSMASWRQSWTPSTSTPPDSPRDKLGASHPPLKGGMKRSLMRRGSYSTSSRT